VSGSGLVLAVEGAAWWHTSPVGHGYLSQSNFDSQWIS
jgi:hypothetical protein